MTAHPHDADDRPAMPRGCRVTDDGPCAQGLYIDEHILRDHQWLHPVGLDEKGYWTWDEEEAV